MTEDERKKSKMEQTATEKKKRRREDDDQGDEERMRPEVQEEAGEKRKRGKGTQMMFIVHLHQSNNWWEETLHRTKASYHGRSAEVLLPLNLD